MKSLSERAGYLQEKLDCSFGDSVIIALLMDVFDECNDIRKELVTLNHKQDELLDTYPIEEETPIEGEEWKNASEKGNKPEGNQ